MAFLALWVGFIGTGAPDGCVFPNPIAKILQIISSIQQLQLIYNSFSLYFGSFSSLCLSVV